MNDDLSEVEDVTNEETETTPEKRPLARIVGIILIVTAVLAAWLLLVGFLGYQSGQQLLTEKQEAEFVAAINRQIDLAREDLAQEKYQLVGVRLDWILEREPQNPDALALKQELESALIIPTLVAEPEIVETAVPTPPSSTTTEPTTEDQDSLNEEIQRIRRLVATKTWAEALSALLLFQIESPNFARAETDRLLFEIYTAYGIELLNGDNVELGLNYLLRAEKLGNLPQEVDDYRLWAALYSQGISYYGVNWDLSASFFRDLCLSAPFFHNSCDLLYEISINQAEHFAANLDWCPALSYYEEASFQQSSGELNGQIAYARDQCFQATVTPSEPISDTVTITDTEQLPPVEIPTDQP